MKNTTRLARATACLLLATAGVHAHAQLPLQAAAADPQASVPPTRYQSTLDVTPPAALAASPDRNWVASNQAVAATSSMALTMKPTGGHASHAMPASQAPGGMSMAPGPAAGGMQCMGGQGSKGCACCAKKEGAAAAGAAGEGGQCMAGGDAAAKGAGMAMDCCMGKMKDAHAHPHQDSP